MGLEAPCPHNIAGLLVLVAMGLEAPCPHNIAGLLVLVAMGLVSSSGTMSTQYCWVISISSYGISVIIRHYVHTVLLGY